MNRRQFLESMALALGAQMVMPLQRVMAANVDIDPVNLTGVAALFSESERAHVAAISEVIMPTTDTPGAIEAGVPQYIEFMLGEWYEETERDRFTTALRRWMGTLENNFIEASQDQQHELVQRLHDGRVAEMTDGGREFFEHVKQLTLAGYYTSEVGMTIERRYLPVPGYYDGHYEYEKVGTLFTA